MIVNPKKIQEMLALKRKSTIMEDLTICINDVDMKPKNSIKFLKELLQTQKQPPGKKKKDLGLQPKESLAQVFSCGFCEVSKNTFFTEPLWSTGFIDNKPSFENHITSICKSASCQLNALFRLKNVLGFKESKLLIESFVYPSFNYCPPVWHFCNQKSSQKVENLQKGALQFL